MTDDERGQGWGNTGLEKPTLCYSKVSKSKLKLKEVKPTLAATTLNTLKEGRGLSQRQRPLFHQHSQEYL